MSEDKEKKKAEEPTAGDSGEGDKPKEPQVTIDANAAAERLEKANAEAKKLITKQEELAAKDALGGKGETGPTRKPEDKSAEEYAQEFSEGKIENPFK